MYIKHVHMDERHFTWISVLYELCVCLEEPQLPQQWVRRGYMKIDVMNWFNFAPEGSL